MPDLKHFQFEIDRVGIATVRFDRAGESVNSLEPEIFEEFVELIVRCESDPAVRAVVIASAKDNSFVIGGDLRWLRTLRNAEDSRPLFRSGHEALAQLEGLWRKSGKPVVAAIHGTCLGGGLEIALACTSRIATDHEATRLGQPEVKVGLIPGAGGTQRLPRRIGLAAGLDLILTGRSVRPRRALHMGLVDQVCAPEELMDQARKTAVAAISSVQRRRRRRGLQDTVTALLERNRLGRRVIYARAEKATQKATKGLYPAPLAALRAVRTGIEEGPAAGYASEAAEFATLLASPEAEALISLFFATQGLKRDSGTAKPRRVKKLGIIGGGLMGAGIGVVSITRSRVATVLKELDDNAVATAISNIEDGARTVARKRGIPPEPMLDLLTGTTKDADLRGADVIIEAVFEDLDLKRDILARVEEATGPDTIFASNTSAIPIGEIAAAARRPQNVIGMHYFSPVERMPLLEVVAFEGTGEAAIETCVDFGKRQGKTVIVVNDGPGFYTTRILAPYGAEVLHLLCDGASIEDIDSAMVAWGFPVGPITLMDEVGIDVGAKIAVVMETGLGSRLSAPAGFAALVEDGRLGRKNGRGFYRYDKGKRRGVDETVYDVLGVGRRGGIRPKEIQDRLSLQMINEAALCLEEGILNSAADGDVGAVMGLGFPPFRGGPFFYVDRAGAADIVGRLEELATEHGDRFEPAAILREHAKAGTRFRVEG